MDVLCIRIADKQALRIHFSESKPHPFFIPFNFSGQPLLKMK
jgi:hypothetical protein